MSGELRDKIKRVQDELEETYYEIETTRLKEFIFTLSEEEIKEWKIFIKIYEPYREILEQCYPLRPVTPPVKPIELDDEELKALITKCAADNITFDYVDGKIVNIARLDS